MPITNVIGSGIGEIAEASNDPTGFVNQTDSVITIVEGTRTLSITPTVDEYDFWSAGTKRTKTAADSVVWTDVEGTHFFYFDSDGVLQHSESFNISFILGSDVYVASMYWDAVNKEVLLGSFNDERHGMAMTNASHYHFHNGFGTQIYSGLTLADISADQDGSADAHAQFGVATGVIADEDVVKSVSAVASTTGIPVMYLLGAGALARNGSPDSGFSVLTTGTGRLAYNEFTGGAWQLTEVTNISFVLYHIFTTTMNDDTKRAFAIVGQNEYLTVVAARAGAQVEIAALTTGEIPIQEYVAVATVIFQTADSYSNTVQARIRTTDEGDDYIDWRVIKGVSQG